MTEKKSKTPPPPKKKYVLHLNLILTQYNTQFESYDAGQLKVRITQPWPSFLFSIFLTAL